MILIKSIVWVLLNVFVSPSQPIAVSLNRSDYMLDQSEDGSAALKQIEFNTFSVAGFGVTDSLPEVHRCDEAAITSYGFWNAGIGIVNPTLESSVCEMWGESGLL